MDINKMKTRLQTLIGSSLKFNTVIPELEPLTLWSLPMDEYETVIQCLVDMYDQKLSGEVYRARLDRILDSVLDDNTPPQAIDSFSKMPRRIIRKIKSYWCHQPH